jgi:hypothetical protein
MLFHLNHDTECELTTFVGRTQKSGKDDVPAVSFRLKLASVRNELLDLFSPTMRLTVYAPVEGQEQLPGVEVTTPILRSKDLKHWAPETCLEGWTVVVARGITEDSALQMGSCKIDDFRFDFFEGGHMDVDFRVSTADVDEAGAGMLWGRQKRKVFVTVTPPEAPPKAIDGSTEAFKKDHPGAADGQADLLDTEAGDAFSAEHGGPDEEHTDDDGSGHPDTDGAPGAGSSDEQLGKDWPFPRDGTEGAAGGPDAGAGETTGADPEPPKPRGRRSRKAADVE